MKLEVNMVVADAREAADFYKKLLDAEILSKTDLDGPLNETRMVVGNIEVRVLDENKDYALIAPKDGVTTSIWMNIIVENINKQYDMANKLGCSIISPVTEFPENNAINFVFKDKYGHVWVVNQNMN